MSRAPVVTNQLHHIEIDEVSKRYLREVFYGPRSALRQPSIRNYEYEINGEAQGGSSKNYIFYHEYDQHGLCSAYGYCVENHRSDDNAPNIHGFLAIGESLKDCLSSVQNGTYSTQRLAVPVLRDLTKRYGEKFQEFYRDGEAHAKNVQNKEKVKDFFRYGDESRFKHGQSFLSRNKVTIYPFYKVGTEEKSGYSSYERLTGAGGFKNIEKLKRLLVKGWKDRRDVEGREYYIFVGSEGTLCKGIKDFDGEYEFTELSRGEIISSGIAKEIGLDMEDPQPPLSASTARASVQPRKYTELGVEIKIFESTDPNLSRLRGLLKDGDGNNRTFYALIERVGNESSRKKDVLAADEGIFRVGDVIKIVTNHERRGEEIKSDITRGLVQNDKGIYRAADLYKFSYAEHQPSFRKKEDLQEYTGRPGSFCSFPYMIRYFSDPENQSTEKVSTVEKANKYAGRIDGILEITQARSFSSSYLAGSSSASSRYQ